MKREKIAPHQVADRVAERIERMIGEGTVRRDQPLPSERRLCASLGVSRSALREGLKLLRERGVIRTEHGRGSFVSELEAPVERRALEQLFSRQNRTLFDLLEVRLLLEGEAARLAASRATPLDLLRLKRCHAALSAASSAQPPQDPAAIAALDHAFHRAICEASHNPVLLSVLDALDVLVLGSVRACVYNLFSRPECKQVLDRQHARLYRAVAERAPDRAERIAREHIRTIHAQCSEIESGGALIRERPSVDVRITERPAALQ